MGRIEGMEDWVWPEPDLAFFKISSERYLEEEGVEEEEGMSGGGEGAYKGGNSNITSTDMI